MHETGKIAKPPNQTMCHAETQDEIKQEEYFKKYAPYQQIDTGQYVYGSNYMTYNENPNPYNLDYKLYDKDEVNKQPVGVNYVSTKP